MTYNGWKNRATWAYGVHHDDMIDDQAAAVVDWAVRWDTEGASVADIRDAAVRQLADNLRDGFENAVEELDLPGWLSDLIDDDIDWSTIADHAVDASWDEAIARRADATATKDDEDEDQDED